MRHISLSQFLILLFIGILLFSDFSKIIKKIKNLFKIPKDITKK